MMSIGLPTIGSNVENTIRLSIVQNRTVRATYSRSGARALAEFTSGYVYDAATRVRRYRGCASGSEWAIDLIDAPAVDASRYAPLQFTTIKSNPLCWDRELASKGESR